GTPVIITFSEGVKHLPLQSTLRFLSMYGCKRIESPKPSLLYKPATKKENTRWAHHAFYEPS
ncbi:hypothetical protein ACNA6I_19550, partial [Rossellomorea sp. FS2]|uniref:hypothetical protein n=1 Tax=Rossellomorea sp. FS2 TaxID=3391447 RepID=UPI003A4DC101